MNKIRRQELKMVIRELRAIKHKDDLDTCIASLETLKDEEQDYFDNIPENLQYSQRSEAAEEAIERLEEALDVLNEIYYNADSSLEDIEDAINLIEEVI